MPEIKHTFLSGRMNKDLDERLIPNGEYIDALNIQISSSESSDVGAVENLPGNKLLSSIPTANNATVIGSYAYTLKDKVYWFLTSDTSDAVYEFDEKTGISKPIIFDAKASNDGVLNSIGIRGNADGELILYDFAEGSINNLLGTTIPTSIKGQGLVGNNIVLTIDSKEIIISIPKNTTILRNADNELTFKNIEYDYSDFGGIDISFSYTTSGVLNFSKDNLITGINIIDGLLFWTDNFNQPRRINIKDFSRGNIEEGKDTKISFEKKQSDGSVVTETRPFIEDDISVIKKAPMKSPSLILKDTKIEGVNEITETFNLFEKEAGDDIILSNVDPLPTWKIGDKISITNSELNASEITAVVSEIEASKSEEETTGWQKTSTTNYTNYIKLNIKSLDIDGDDEINNAVEAWQLELEEGDPIYELTFVRFAYRWKYKDGEYSSLSPFTVPAFIPGEHQYDTQIGLNYGMLNELKKIILKDFDLGGSDVESIDVVFKEVKNSNIYTLQNKKKLDFPDVYEITKEQIHAVLPNDQLLRQWDNVPRRALAQEITANRIIYGNYVQNYDILEDPEFAVKLKGGETEHNRSIKSNRNYQIGVVYTDEYNRQSPVLSNDSGSIKIGKENSTVKNQFEISLKNNPPAWATHYKFFVKDTSSEYYNIAADRFYVDESTGLVYVSFSSSDRNKITEDTYLFLKKKHGSDDPITSDDNRYKILDIYNEAPDFVCSRKTLKDTFDKVIFDTAFGQGGSTQNTRTPNQTPTGGGEVVLIAKVDGGEVSASKQTNIKPGNYISFKTGESETNRYEIREMETHIDGSVEVRIKIEGQFGEEVEELYAPDGKFLEENNVVMKVWAEETRPGDTEFDGRFFVKLLGNNTFTTAIKGDDDYVIKKSFLMDSQWRQHKLTQDIKRYRNSTPNHLDYPLYIVIGDNGEGGGPNLTISHKDGGDYDLLIEECNHRVEPAVIQSFHVGAFIRFSNHDTIYHIGEIKEEFSEGKKQMIGGGKNKIYRRYLKFTDAKHDTRTGLTTSLGLTKNEGKDKAEKLDVQILGEADSNKIPFSEKAAIFETEPADNKVELNLYYETEKAFPIIEHGKANTIDWFNVFCFGNGVESNRIRDDYNAPYINSGVKASTTLAEPFKEEHKFNGLIYSGIINSRSSTNKTNEFNTANVITKDLLPSYGSIQKLYARDSDLIALCEDKIVKILADKDQLYNADGSSNIVASNNVLGSLAPFAGEYGISLFPQSFTAYGFRAYFVDKTRGVVLRLSQDGLTVISEIGMSNFFSDRLLRANSVIGSYDSTIGCYNITFPGLDTVCFDENVNGWITRKSYTPECAISLNDTYYSFYNGGFYRHNDPTAKRNNFYGQQFSSKIRFNLNDEPSVIKRYKTLGYEGSAGWEAIEIETDQSIGNRTTFKDKENKYFANINQESKDISNIDFKNFSSQGIGSAVDIEIDEGQATSSIKITNVTYDTISCYGGKTAITISVEGGSGEYEYSINGTDFVGSIETTYAFVGITSGDYTIYAKDGRNQILKTREITITEPSELGGAATVTKESAAGENDGAITVVPSGGAGGYSVVCNGVTDSSSPYSFANLPDATYSYTITDANGCTFTDSATVVTGATAISVVSLSAASISCFGGNATVTMTVVGGSGNYAYSSDNSTYTSSGSSATHAFTNTAAGSHTFYAKDTTSNTVVSDTIKVTQPPKLSATYSVSDETGEDLNDGSVTITPTGGTGNKTVTINGQNVTSAPYTFTNLAPGDYDFTVTDASSCTYSGAFRILGIKLEEPQSDIIKIALKEYVDILGEKRTIPNENKVEKHPKRMWEAKPLILRHDPSTWINNKKYVIALTPKTGYKFKLAPSRIAGSQNRSNAEFVDGYYRKPDSPFTPDTENDLKRFISPKHKFPTSAARWGVLRTPTSTEMAQYFKDTNNPGDVQDLLIAHIKPDGIMREEGIAKAGGVNIDIIIGHLQVEEKKSGIKGTSTLHLQNTVTPTDANHRGRLNREWAVGDIGVLDYTVEGKSFERILLNRRTIRFQEMSDIAKPGGKTTKYPRNDGEEVEVQDFTAARLYTDNRDIKVYAQYGKTDGVTDKKIIILEEYLVIPKGGGIDPMVNNNYNVYLLPRVINKPPKQIKSWTVDTSPVGEKVSNRKLTIIGDPGARFIWTFSPASETYTPTSGIKLMPKTGRMEFYIGFNAAPPYTATWTLSLQVISKGPQSPNYNTIFSPNFKGNNTANPSIKTLTFSRNTLTEYTKTFIIKNAGVAVETITKKGNKTTGGDVKFKTSTSLASPSGTYSIVKQPTHMDVTGGESLITPPSGSRIKRSSPIYFKFNTLTYNASGHVVALDGIMQINKFTESHEVFELELTDFVTEDGTITFNYSTTMQAGTSTANYAITANSGSPTSYALSYRKGATIFPSWKIFPTGQYHRNGNAIFTFNLSSGYLVNPAAEFALYDSGGNNVTTTYAETVTTNSGPENKITSPYISTRTTGGNNSFSIIVNLKKMRIPTTNATFTLKPLTQPAIAIPTSNYSECLLFVYPKLTLNPRGFNRYNGGHANDPQKSNAKIYAQNTKIDPNNFGGELNSLGARKDANGSWKSLGVKAMRASAPYRSNNKDDSKYNEIRHWGLKDDLPRDFGVSGTIATPRIITNGGRTNLLIQWKFGIGDRVNYWWDSENISSASHFAINNTYTAGHSHWLTLSGSSLGIVPATSGSYTDLWGDTVTVGGAFSVSTDKKTLTVNCLCNLSNTTIKGKWVMLDIKTAIVNDDGNYQKLEYSSTLDEKGQEIYDNECEIVFDQNKTIKDFYVYNSNKIQNGNLFYSKEADEDDIFGNTSYNWVAPGNDYLPSKARRDRGVLKFNNNKYFSKNNEILYTQTGPHTFAARESGSMSVKSHYIDTQYKMKLTDTVCPINPTSDGTIELTKVRVDLHRPSHYIDLYATHLRGQTVKIEGTYIDVRNINTKIYPDGWSYIQETHVVPGYGTRHVGSGDVAILMTNGYPLGVPPEIVFESLNYVISEKENDIKINDKTKNTWEATVTFDSDGRGTINLKLAEFRNLILPYIVLQSPQFTGVWDRNLGSLNNSHYHPDKWGGVLVKQYWGNSRGTEDWRYNQTAWGTNTPTYFSKDTGIWPDGNYGTIQLPGFGTGSYPNSLSHMSHLASSPEYCKDNWRMYCIGTSAEQMGKSTFSESTAALTGPTISLYPHGSADHFAATLSWEDGITLEGEKKDIQQPALAVMQGVKSTFKDVDGNELKISNINYTTNYMDGSGVESTTLSVYDNKTDEIKVLSESLEDNYIWTGGQDPSVFELTSNFSIHVPPGYKNSCEKIDITKTTAIPVYTKRWLVDFQAYTVTVTHPSVNQWKSTQSMTASYSSPTGSGTTNSYLPTTYRIWDINGASKDIKGVIGQVYLWSSIKPKLISGRTSSGIKLVSSHPWTPWDKKYGGDYNQTMWFGMDDPNVGTNWKYFGTASSNISSNTYVNPDSSIYTMAGNGNLTYNSAATIGLPGSKAKISPSGLNWNVDNWFLQKQALPESDLKIQSVTGTGKVVKWAREEWIYQHMLLGTGMNTSQGNFAATGNRMQFVKRGPISYMLFGNHCFEKDRYNDKSGWTGWIKYWPEFLAYGAPKPDGSYRTQLAQGLYKYNDYFAPRAWIWDPELAHGDKGGRLHTSPTGMGLSGGASAQSSRERGLNGLNLVRHSFDNGLSQLPEFYTRIKGKNSRDPKAEYFPPLRYSAGRWKFDIANATQEVYVNPKPTAVPLRYQHNNKYTYHPHSLNESKMFKSKLSKLERAFQLTNYVLGMGVFKQPSTGFNYKKQIGTVASLTDSNLYMPDGWYIIYSINNTPIRVANGVIAQIGTS